MDTQFSGNKWARPLPRHYNIETTAQLCGVLPVNLRTWQRLGLIQPRHDERGSRWYSDNDLTRLYSIVKTLSAGIPIGEIRPHIDTRENYTDIRESYTLSNDNVARHNSSWRGLQAEILNCLGEGEWLKLRRLIWRFGREYPLSYLVNRVFRPIRAFLTTSTQATLIQQKGLFDSILLEYATYMMRALRHKTRAQVLLLPMQIDDPLELWLESLRLSGEGLNVEIVRAEVEEPDLAAFGMEHYLIWSDCPLNERQQAVFDAWLQRGLPVMLLGKASHLKAVYKYQSGV